MVFTTHLHDLAKVFISPCSATATSVKLLEQLAVLLSPRAHLTQTALNAALTLYMSVGNSLHFVFHQ